MLTKAQINLMGLVVSGDVDGLTIYTDHRGRKVAFPAAPPSKPLTEWQLAWQRNLKTGMALWRRLSVRERLDYRRACDLAGLCMLGHNLWLHCYLGGDREILETFKWQYGLSLTPPPDL